MGSLTVIRDKALWRDRGRAYILMIDGETVGPLRSGETLSVSLAPGMRRVSLKIDWCGSPELLLDGSTDHTLHCKAGAGKALTDILFRQNQYISLEKA